MYNKLFTKILDSSIWMESSPTRIVWMTFIAAMDEDGFAQFAGIPNLAHRAIVTTEEATTAVKSLESPDPDSSDPEHEGRRIERVPGGWMVLNASKYKDIVTRLAGKEANRRRVAKHRAAHKSEKRAEIDAEIERIGKCPCCGLPFEKPYSLYVTLDHDHKTGAVRDYICQSCNKIVGFLEDGTPVRSPKVAACSDYIRLHSNVTTSNLNVMPRNSPVMQSDTDSDTTTDTETEKKSRLQAAPKKRVRKKQQLPKPIDEAFLSEMQADPRYVSLDVQACYVKCERWNEDRNQFPSRASFRTWLDKELEFKRQGQQRNGTPTKSNRDSRVGASPPPPPKCGKPARFTYDWPGRDSGVCCEDCATNARLAAAALGETVTIAELTGEPQICP